jgi:hypothetical protein
MGLVYGTSPWRVFIDIWTYVRLQLRDRGYMLNETERARYDEIQADKKKLKDKKRTKMSRTAKGKQRADAKTKQNVSNHDEEQAVSGAGSTDTGTKLL